MTEHTVNDLNPKGQVVKGMEMSVRRSRRLGKLIRLIHDQTSDLATTRRTTPLAAGVGSRTEIRQVFGDSPWAHPLIRFPDMWAWTVDHWYSGAMERSEKAMLANLPDSIREKLSE